VGKGWGQGFRFFQICGIENLANSSKNLTKLVECTPQKKKNPKFPDTFAKKARNFIRKKSLDGV
jgi:hypothetical protein